MSKFPASCLPTLNYCYFATCPQVFESLRSQADYEGLLKGLRAAGSSGSALPGLWVKGIAAQLRSKGQRVGRCGAVMFALLRLRHNKCTGPCGCCCMVLNGLLIGQKTGVRQAHGSHQLLLFDPVQSPAL